MNTIGAASNNLAIVGTEVSEQNRKLNNARLKNRRASKTFMYVL